MPAKVSDIHEISVIVGFQNKEILKKSTCEKFKIFSKAVLKLANGKINISKSDFKSNEAIFDRGICISKLFRKAYGISGKKLNWTGIKNHKEDSSDIYVDDIGISLKDSSKIIRNSGFEQLINTFCEKPIRKFKDPFWEFAPKLSAGYLLTVIEDCYKRGFLKISNNRLEIGNEIKTSFKGDIKNLLKLNLNELSKILKKSDIKELVKDFSKNGNLKNLLKIRESLVNEVSKKVVANLTEGLIQNPNYFSNKIKYMLQYRKKEKLFGFSSSKEIFVGIIKSNKEVFIQGEKVFTELSKLTEKTTGLQINIYTDISIEISGKKEKVRLQNQLRYKHRTFSCAPEANFHLLKYSDWKKLYPPE